MKRLFLSVVISVITLISFAQTDSKHITFKGIPIDGTLTSFVSKMKAAGFTEAGLFDGIAALKGDFASYKNCTVLVSMIKATNKVNTVAVMFPEYDQWSQLENNYKYLKTMLTEKYGEPTDCVEEFQDKLPPTDDSQKIYSLKFDRCTYYTTFKTSKGDIQLSLFQQDRTECFVKLQYWDKINTDAVHAKAIDDL